MQVHTIWYVLRIFIPGICTVHIEVCAFSSRTFASSSPTTARPVFSRASGCRTRRRSAGTLRQYGARLGPGRTSWRVLWASRVARAGSFLRDCVPRRVAKEYGTHTCCFWLCSKQCCLCTSHSLLSVFLPLWKPYTEPLYNSSCVSSFLLLDSYGTRYMYAPWLLSFYVPAQIPQ